MRDSFIGEPGAIIDGGGTVVQAIWGHGGATGQRDVTVRGLVIQSFVGEFSDPARRGAIKTGANWLVEDNEIHDNNEIGVSVGSGAQVRRVLLIPNRPQILVERIVSKLEGAHR